MLSIMWQLADDEPVYPPPLGRFIKYHLYWNERNTVWLSKETGITYQKLRRLINEQPHSQSDNMERLSAQDCIALAKWSGVPAHNWMFLQALFDLWEEQTNTRIDKRRRYERREDDAGSDNGETHLLGGRPQEDAEAASRC